MVAACALVVGSQLLVIVLQPPWGRPVTDWLRAALAWPELLILVIVSLWLSRHRRLEAVTWWLFSGGVLCYAVARTWWTVDDALIYHHGVPFPILPDLFFVLQYPFYILAVILIPFGSVWGSRLLAVLDALLWIVAATALSWYFLLAPLFTASGLSPLAKVVSVGYPTADLFLFLALMLILLRPLRYHEDRPVLGIVIAAVICLLVADTGAILFIILHPAHEYRTAQFPDLFWLTSDLLIPLAAVVQVRVVQRVHARERHTLRDRMTPPGRQGPEDLQMLEWTDVRAALRLFLPLVAALLASVAILLRAAITATASGTWESLLTPLVVSVSLLLLVIVRQAVVYVEMARLRRTVVAAQAEERALRALDERKDEFLGVVSHEMRTPLSSLEIFFGVLAHRFDSLFAALQSREEGVVGAFGDGGSVGDSGYPRERQSAAGALREALVHAQASVWRLTRLAGDLVDDSRIRHGRLALRLEPCDLVTIVTGAVEEERAAEPDRTILLEVSGWGDQPSQQARPRQRVPVLADTDRIAQVVTNYLTNALKYSAVGRPVTVWLEVIAGARERANGDMHGSGARDGGDEERDLARVSVQDDGIGVPLAEQLQVWERFHIVEGNTVQDGSGTSLGLGLHICKTIIEEHHGQVGVQSVPGHGSTFWFTLPLAPPTPPTLSTGSSATSPGAG
jgi:signal transduction histidine kinase